MVPKLLVAIFVAAAVVVVLVQANVGDNEIEHHPEGIHCLS